MPPSTGPSRPAREDTVLIMAFACTSFSSGTRNGDTCLYRRLIEAGYTEQQNQGHKNESHKVHLPGKQKKQENDTRRGKIRTTIMFLLFTRSAITPPSGDMISSGRNASADTRPYKAGDWEIFSRWSGRANLTTALPNKRDNLPDDYQCKISGKPVFLHYLYLHIFYFICKSRVTSDAACQSDDHDSHHDPHPAFGPQHKKVRHRADQNDSSHHGRHQ